MTDEWRGLMPPFPRRRRPPRLSEEVMKKMGLTKHGSGDILREPEDTAKTAKKDWTEDDAQALVEENKRDGSE